MMHHMNLVVLDSKLALTYMDLHSVVMLNLYIPSIWNILVRKGMDQSCYRATQALAVDDKIELR